ncbi:hypothetical protein CE91St36_22990 [Christensenellaceae bacterium]|nr:hypothetical protein CE91St36_22990 [Christensenellaceae bacterium]BDF62147.1 hypothetical protein CE91St37_22970 [Christensenellaceae bacterium]
MQRVDSFLEVNTDEIPVDTFWSTGTEKELKMHRIHAYPAKFPAFITQKAIQYAKENQISVHKIADIFCGCGTVAFEAKRVGIDFWGCDLNPTAVLIARVKSNNYFEDKIDYYYDLIIRKYDNLYPFVVMPEKVNERIKYWFEDEAIKDLSLLKACITNVVPKSSKYRQYFLCAFSNILKATSKWLTKSIKPQIDPNKKSMLVRTAYANQCELMKKAIQEYDLHSSSRTIIKTQNALNIDEAKSTDLIVTSPPYVTSYEYADLHQLSTLWLGYADDYKELRKNSIGSSYHTTKKSDMEELNQAGSIIVKELLEVDRSKAYSVMKYYLDMQKITDVCKKMLKNNGMILMVIGNTEYKGVRIDNAKHLLESMQNSGFKNLEITKRKITGKILTPYRDAAGRFSSNNNEREVYAEEFIVVGRN